MNYETVEYSNSEEIIRNYIDPFKVERNEFESNYSCNCENVEYEIKRLHTSLQSIIKNELGF